MGNWESKLVCNLVGESRKLSGSKKISVGWPQCLEEIQYILITLVLNPHHISHIQLIPLNN